MRRKRIRLGEAIPTLATSGIFTALADYDVPWHDTVTPAILDMLYAGHSSEKLVSPIIRQAMEDGVVPAEAMDNLAEGLTVMYETKWDKLWATMNLQYSPIENYNMQESESIDRDETRSGTDTGTVTTVTDEETTDTGTLDRDTTDTEQRGIYGFDSATASDADTTETSGEYQETRNLATTHDNTETATRNLANSETAGTEEERTLTRRGNIGVTTTQQMITQEREVWQWLFFEQVFRDVDRVFCLSIY